MENKELIDRLINEVGDLRNKAEDREEYLLAHNFKYQAAAVSLKVDAYNEVLGILREAKREIERESRKCYNFETNLKDIEIEWVK